jgi:hypothetical protein
MARTPSLRVYIPATFGMLGTLARDERLAIHSGLGFAFTPALRDFYEAGDDEEIEYSAFLEAARASLRLLTAGDDRFPHRRVVISADVPESAVTYSPEKGEAVVTLTPPEITVDQLAAIHVDDGDNEDATAAAVKVVDVADLGDEDAEIAVGDAEDNLMSWYDAKELGVLVDLL